MKKVILVHGWGNKPDDIWFPWLKAKLEGRGFVVEIPELPKFEDPRIEAWVSKLGEVTGVVDQDTYFVGHSMGCQTIARFLERLPTDTKVGGVLFVAGFFKSLTTLGRNEAERSVCKEWLGTPINLSKVASHILKSVALFSDNDKYVPLDNQDDFVSILKSKVVVVPKEDHFGGIRKEMPIILDLFDSIVN